MRHNRRQFLKGCAGVAALTALPSALQAFDPKDGRGKPNIVFCLTDDQGYGDVGYMGHPRLKTPHLDAMAAEGLRMTHFYSAAANCSPSRATCLTGRHHRRCGVPDHSHPINPDEITIAHALGASGYATGHFGKWHLGKVERDAYDNPASLGFKKYFSTSNNAKKVNPSGFVSNFEQLGKGGRLQGEVSAVTMDKALAFMGGARKERRPFLAYIWFHTPHTPYGSTPEYLAMYKDVASEKERSYYAQLTAMDVQMGRLREQLRTWKIADDTLLVFTSDNGPAGPGSAGGLKGKKGRMSEGGCRVPGLIEWPAVVQRARTSDLPMVTTDLYPTFLAAAGVNSFGPDRIIDGENMLPMIQGKRHQRQLPIRFRHRGTAVVGNDGVWRSADADRGYEAWAESVEQEYAVAQARIKELKGAKRRKP